MNPTTDDTRDEIAAMICDDAYQHADRLHGWADSGADVHATYRRIADKLLRRVRVISGERILAP